jgi:hypothetical protein
MVQPTTCIQTLEYYTNAAGFNGLNKLSTSMGSWIDPE